MMYILKFILLWILPPGCIILLLIALAAYLFKCKAKGRYALAVITLFLYFSSLMPVAQMLTHGLEGRYAQPASVNVDVVAVLGGGAFSRVSDVDGDGALTAVGMNRLITGARLERLLNVPVIVSGGKVFDDSAVEADVSKRVLIGLGLPQDMVYTDSKALNTKQNAANIIAVCQKEGWQRAAVVTSALHMPRAMQNFQAAAEGTGIEIIAYPCDYLVSGEMSLSPFSFVPQAYALDLSAMAVKEYLAIAAGKFL